MAMRDDDKLLKLARKLGDLLGVQKCSLVVAESCTGGWLSHVLTSVPNSSTWFERGLITYSDESKTDLLRVDQEIIKEKGPVSKEVAIAMAKGALENSKAQISVAITGLAGPNKDGESSVPIGTCWFCWVLSTDTLHYCTEKFDGDRIDVNYQAVDYALTHLIALLTSHPIKTK